MLYRLVVAACVSSPLSAACTLAPTVPLRLVVFPLAVCAPVAGVGFSWLVVSLWPLQSGHRVQHLSGHVSAFVVYVAIAKWSQGAAVVCSCVRLGQPFYPLFAALKGPFLPPQSRDCPKPCRRPSFQFACGPSCCGAVRGLTLCCSCWALAFSWSPFVPLKPL